MIRRLGRAVLVLLLALVAALALAMVIVPRVMGWVPLTILSGSMEPTIPTGSQVVVAPVEGADGAAGVQVGDVITVMPYPDDDTLVTHRVVARTEAADGAVALTTQGDANASADPWTVTGTRLRGVVRYHVPYAGYLATALDGHQKQMGTVVVAVALLGYAAVQVLAAVRGARAGERPAAGAGTGPRCRPTASGGRSATSRNRTPGRPPRSSRPTPRRNWKPGRPPMSSRPTASGSRPAATRNPTSGRGSASSRRPPVTRPTAPTSVVTAPAGRPEPGLPPRTTPRSRSRTPAARRPAQEGCGCRSLAGRP